jgi:hypothetical protein
VLKSTSGSPFGPYAPLVHGVPGGDVSLFQDPVDNNVYTLSSGSCISASLLSTDMTRIVDQTCVSSECGSEDCTNSTIGFEGPFAIVVNGTCVEPPLPPPSPPRGGSNACMWPVLGVLSFLSCCCTYSRHVPSHPHAYKYVTSVKCSIQCLASASSAECTFSRHVPSHPHACK